MAGSQLPLINLIRRQRDHVAETFDVVAVIGVGVVIAKLGNGVVERGGNDYDRLSHYHVHWLKPDGAEYDHCV